MPGRSVPVLLRFMVSRSPSVRSRQPAFPGALWLGSCRPGASQVPGRVIYLGRRRIRSRRLPIVVVVGLAQGVAHHPSGSGQPRSLPSLELTLTRPRDAESAARACPEDQVDNVNWIIIASHGGEPAGPPA